MNDTNNLDDQEKVDRRRKRQFAMRINMFFFVMFLLFSVLILRLAFLQFVKSDEYAALKRSNSKKDVVISPIRGNIYDLNGAPIAATVSVQSAFYQMLPNQKKEDKIALAYKLEEVFRTYGDENGAKPTAEEILEAMDVGFDLAGNKTKDPQYTYWPRRIKADLTIDEIAYLSEHRDELLGIEISEESTRVYAPDGNKPVAVQLVGYLRPFKTVENMTSKYLQPYRDHKDDYRNEEYIGLEGLEFLYQDELRGTNGKKTFPVNSLNQITGQAELTKPEKGNNLYLTLNRDIQMAAEQAIEDHLVTLQQSRRGDPYDGGQNALAGYAVAMEVDSGRVVAMASMPDYDPNEWTGGISTAKWDEIKFKVPNGTITDRQPNILDDDERKRHPGSLIPPGSVLKPLSVLIGLNEGFFTPSFLYNDKGIYEYGKDNNSKIRNSGGVRNGLISPITALVKSSNTFMAEMVGAKLYSTGNGLEIWDKHMKEFGLGVSTESGLPNEHEGLLEYNITEGMSVQANLVQGSFGQRARYTTLQLAQYTMMLANKGKRYKPLFVDRITTYENELVEKIEPELLNEVELPDAYWNVIRDGMQSSVGGFEGVNYTFARKTGTSQSNVAGQRDPVDNAIFIAYAPVVNPKLAIAVVVPEGGFGRNGAAPIARKIFDVYDQYIGLDGVPKGKPVETEEPTP